MNTELRRQAEELSSQPYFYKVRLDHTTDEGDIYVAEDPGLEGCIAQGETIEEAIRNLNEARIDFIQSLLEDHLPIPQFTKFMQMTGTTESNTFIFEYSADKNQQEIEPIPIRKQPEYLIENIIMQEF